MDRQRLYRLLQPGNPELAAWIWRVIHHSMVAAGIGVFLGLTVVEWRSDYGQDLAIVFFVVAGFFVLDYLLRLYSAASAPGSEHRGHLSARLAWVVSLGGLFDLLGAAPGIIAVVDRREASLFG